MKLRHACRAASLAIPIAFGSVPLLAGPQDYEFRLVAEDIRQNNEAIVEVTLVDKRTGAAVPDAVIFATRMDMHPDGMEAMVAIVEPVPPAKTGIYRFRTNLMMAGNWRFSLAAKVQGEQETVEARLVFEVVP